MPQLVLLKYIDQLSGSWAVHAYPLAMPLGGDEHCFIANDIKFKAFSRSTEAVMHTDQNYFKSIIFGHFSQHYYVCIQTASVKFLKTHVMLIA